MLPIITRRSNRPCRLLYVQGPKSFHGTTSMLVGMKRKSRSSVDSLATTPSKVSAGPYGLTMVDYSVVPPPWPLPLQPPAIKGRGSTVARFLAPALMTAFIAGTVYVYFNQDDSIMEYWKQVEQGNVPLDDDDDYDDDDDWEDDDDDDEWEDEPRKAK